MSNGKRINLVDAIGKPAMLEQLAEECSELAFAALKCARYIRNENKVHGKSKEELTSNLCEEMADVALCMNQMLDGEMVDESYVNEMIDYKYDRMCNRLKKEGKVK